tara:strand:+ start:311 stop:559 length:249 start_codon:yes stop_codon:yes gene_type:complete
MSETKSTSINFIKSILDKKFSNANSSLGDMMKNKAMSAITDMKASFKYIPSDCSKTTEHGDASSPKAAEPTNSENQNGQNGC